MSNIKTLEEMRALAEASGLCGGTISWDDQSTEVEILHLSPTGARISVPDSAALDQAEEAVRIAFSVDRFEDLLASIIWRRESVAGLQFEGAAMVDDSIGWEPENEPDDAERQGAERRTYPRKRVMLAAHLDVESTLYPSRILDISLIGARLQIAEDLPEETLMQLVTKRFGMLPVEVMWRVADHIGVQFLEPPSTINMILKDFLTE